MSYKHADLRVMEAACKLTYLLFEQLSDLLFVLFQFIFHLTEPSH